MRHYTSIKIEMYFDSNSFFFFFFGNKLSHLCLFPGENMYRFQRTKFVNVCAQDALTDLTDNPEIHSLKQQQQTKTNKQKNKQKHTNINKTQPYYIKYRGNGTPVTSNGQITVTLCFFFKDVLHRHAFFLSLWYFFI